MLTTIENPVKNKAKELTFNSSIQATSHAKSKDYQYRNALLRLGMVTACLLMVIFLSLANGKLFLKELLVSSFIIVLLLSFNLMDTKRT